ncbi:MAG: DUF2142 domain-containing protein, partial [Lachnospiraceae bacterium]|nr:DUF2142 domain-containing protein [Lachnospiraceae bacterium]
DLFPRQPFDIYTMPLGIVLEDGAEYQFLIMPSGEGTVGIECLAGTTEPVTILHYSGQRAGIRAASDLLVFLLRAASWCLGLLMIVSLISGKDMGKTAGIVVITAILLSVFAQYSLDQVMESRTGLFMACIFTCAFMMLAVMELYVPRRGIIFAMLLLAAGTSMLAVMPPGMVPDETNHFYRVFEITCGGIFARLVGSEGLPGDVLPAAVQHFRDPAALIDWNDVSEDTFTNTALYSPVCYIPQIIGVKAARYLTGNVQTIFYAGRAAGWLSTMGLFLAALKKMPFGRELLFAVMMLPMTLQEGMSISSDSLTNAVVFFYLAYALYCAAAKEKVGFQERMVLILAGTVAAMCKTVYFVIVLLVLLIPEEKLGGGWKNKIRKFFMMGLPLLISLSVTRLYSGYLISYGENYDAGRQIRYALTHPVETVYAVIRTAVLKAEGWSGSMTGDYLGALDIRTAQIVMILVLILLTCLVMNTGMIESLKGIQTTLIIAAVGILGIGLVMATMYATWTPVGDTMILVIQGRYMLAFLPILLLWAVSGRTHRGTIAPVQAGEESASDRYGYISHLILLTIDAFAVIDVCRYLMVR